MSFNIFFPCVVCGCDVFNLGEFDGELSNTLVVDIYLRGCGCVGINVGEYLVL
jgi:hypothetical protein